MSAKSMNPTDFILFLLSLATAYLAIVVQGWTLHGIGPALLALAGGVWQLRMQWLRHRYRW
jgi:Flp pilus assembly protein TadB